MDMEAQDMKSVNYHLKHSSLAVGVTASSDGTRTPSEQDSHKS